MCGIFGMIGSGAVDKTLSALKRLEYRGYDSAGIAVKNGGCINIYKQAGMVGQLRKSVPADIVGESVIGHTRWATHGEVSQANAHPFISQHKQFAVVHNGIIENHLSLKYRLQSCGAEFTSQTDSEVVAHLLEANFSGDTLAAVTSTAKQLEGSFAVVVTTAHNGNLYAIKRKSPLVVGVSGNEVYFCSDIRCLSQYAVKVAQMPDDTVAVSAPSGSVAFYDFDGNPV